LADARRGLRVRRRRALLTGLGIALATAMLTAALVVSDSLGRGFERGVRAAGLPDIIVRFDPERAGRVSQRIAALPDIAGFSLRQEVTNVNLDFGAHGSSRGSVDIVAGGRRGYAIVSGRDVSGRPGEVVVERGLAVAWGIRLGDTLDVGDIGPQRVVGFSESPDNVSYPLAVPRVYVSHAGLAAAFGPGQLDPRINLAQIWLRDPRNLDEVLVQARATSYGLHNLRFVTRTGVRLLLDQAAGIVIDLLVALSLIALLTAAVMLAASARAEVQRRLQTIGIRRAVGASRAHLVASQALEALLVAAPAATVGAVAGTLATYGSTSRLLIMLNEPPAGWVLAGPLLGTWAVSVGIPVLAAAWPAWRAAGRSAVALLAGTELQGARRSSRMAGRGGIVSLGARLATARRARLIATATALGVSTGFVLLLVALASALTSLETDPGALGKRYQLTASLPAADAQRVSALRGVQAAAPRYEEEAVDSYALGETIDVIAYPGDHTVFEAPPLVAGARLHGSAQAEVGEGLADALGLTPGSTLALQLGSGRELRLRVSGVVGSLDHDGRVAYIPAAALLAADPSASSQLVVRVLPGANPSAVSASLGPSAAPASGAVGRGVPLVATLRAILRAVAIVDALVCLYVLIQTCALTVQERRRTVAMLRAFGAGGSAVGRLLAGAVAALVIPAGVAGIVLERALLGPVLSRLAAGYAALPLGAGAPEIAVVVAGLAVSGAVAVTWVSRQATRDSVVGGLAAP
jgi:ABC-type antimicrobial peptide transport system permease subunit